MGLLKRIVSLIFPPRCTFCGRVSENDICTECKKVLPYCGKLKCTGEFFSEGVAALQYSGIVRSSVMKYKFYGRRAYFKTYARLLAETVTEELSGKFDIITWVPLSYMRLRKRGYDQSRLVAEEIAGTLSVSSSELLVKIRENKVQSRLVGKEKRAANVMGVYEAVNTENIKGKRVLLVDDVVTTGATLSECSRTLLMTGAEDVVCAAVASAMKDR